MLLREMLHTPALEILELLKKSSKGMAVREVSTAMGMSYMGVKQHCVELEKAGFLDTWRRPKGAGRPEKLYRLTAKSDALFGSGSTGLALDLLATAQRVFGETAASKLLYACYQEKAEQWAVKIAKATTLADRVRMLSRLRSAEGYMSEWVADERGHLCIVEYHRPLRAVAEKYTIVDELECGMIARLLGCEVKRSVEEVSGLTRVTFQIKSNASRAT